MTTHQTSFLSEIESGDPIPVGKLAYLRARMRNRLYDFVIDKFLEQERECGLTQAELARRIGRRPEVINRLLSGPGNWRLDTLSDLLVGIAGEELKPESESLLGRAPRNFVCPDWLTMAAPSKTHAQGNWQQINLDEAQTTSNKTKTSVTSKGAS